MQRRDSSVYIGGLIVLFGIVILLQNLGLFGPIAALGWIVLFALGGATLLGSAIQNRERWWAFIPAMLLLSIAALMGVNELAPATGQRWGGSLFLGGFSLAFWGVALRKPDAWWAVIPAGIISTLAVVAGIDQVAAETFAAATLFAGIAITFGVVYLLRRNTEHTTWALIVAGGALVMAMMVLSASAMFFSLLWPLVMITGGIALLVRALRHSEQPKEVERYDNSTLPQSHR